MISGVSGADGKLQVAESEPKVDLSMGRKMNEFPKENQLFRGSVGLTNSAASQNFSVG